MLNSFHNFNRLYPMLPLHKLTQLPRSQRLRKIAKTFAGAELRFAQGAAPFPDTERAWLADALAILIQDDAFSPAARRALDAACDSLRADGPDDAAPEGDRLRAINTVRHILLAETGQQTADWDLIDHGGRLDPEGRRFFPGMTVYLEDIRSPFNVGAMFRTAESFGAARMFLSPLCADPLHPRAERTAMGCVALLPWERLGTEPFSAQPDGGPPRHALPEGPVFALETGGTPLGAFPFPARGTMIVGSEELGVSPAALAAADASWGRVSIPTYGAKGSLNVSAAFGIAMQAWAAALVSY
jgi:TrmH family RNA methyltransferase